MMPDMAWKHGTQNGYGNHNCRCQLCRDANAAQQRERRARWKAEGFKGRNHGTYSLYSMGCRCKKCAEAYRTWAAEHK